MDFEKRHCTEIRATEGGKLTGYAAVFDRPSEDLGGFVEVIERGAFERTLEEDADRILALVEHDMSRPLGRVSNGTLQLEEDDHGLRVLIDPADTSYARDLLELVQRKDVAGMSFRFRPYPDGHSMDMSTEPPTRTLESVQIREVSVVIDPAYPDTTVALRSLQDAQEQEVQHELRKLELRLREFE